MTVDPPGRKGDDAESLGGFEHLPVELLTQTSVESFGVVYPPDLTLPQNDRRRKQRPGQSAASGLVRTR